MSVSPRLASSDSRGSFVLVARESLHFPGLFLTGGEAAVEGPLDLAARAAKARAASTSARLISPSVINWPIEKPAVLRRWLRVPSGAPRTASASPCNAAAALRSSDAGLMAGIR